MADSSSPICSATSSELCTAAAPRRSAWFELEIVVLVLLVSAAFFTRLSALPIRGDESNWAVVAEEMLATGDWVVPRRQGEPFPDRPPLNSWCIALASLVFGHWSPIAVRFPSALAVLMTTLMLYVYSRQYLSRVGSFAAAAGFASMGHELIHGRLGESDNLLTCCLAGALFIWSAGYLRGWSPVLTWTAGYSLAAFAAFAKGPQGPVYFVAATGCFLLVRRDWRYLFSRAHLFGLLAFVAVLGAWQVPFYLRTDWSSVMHVWTEEGHCLSRFDYSDLARSLRHLLTFPLKVLGATAPWSFLLALFATRWLRQSLGQALPFAQFLGVACLVSLPTVWLATDSGPRYILLMYPVAAALVGIVVDRTALAAEGTIGRRSWLNFIRCGMLASLGAALIVVLSGQGLLQPLHNLLQQPASIVIPSLLAVVACVAVMYWAQLGRRTIQSQAGILAIATIMAIAVSGIALNKMIENSLNPAEEVAELRERLPSDVRLVCFGPVHHRFAYYYQEPVEVLDWPITRDTIPESLEYFCITQYEDMILEFPFDWEPIGTVSCDRAPRPRPNRVIIGRRLPIQRASSYPRVALPATASTLREVILR